MLISFLPQSIRFSTILPYLPSRLLNVIDVSTSVFMQGEQVEKGNKNAPESKIFDDNIPLVTFVQLLQSECSKSIIHFPLFGNMLLHVPLASLLDESNKTRNMLGSLISSKKLTGVEQELQSNMFSNVFTLSHTSKGKNNNQEIRVQKNYSSEVLLSHTLVLGVPLSTLAQSYRTVIQYQAERSLALEAVKRKMMVVFGKKNRMEEKNRIEFRAIITEPKGKGNSYKFYDHIRPYGMFNSPRTPKVDLFKDTLQKLNPQLVSLFSTGFTLEKKTGRVFSSLLSFKVYEKIDKNFRKHLEKANPLAELPRFNEQGSALHFQIEKFPKLTPSIFIASLIATLYLFPYIHPSLLQFCIGGKRTPLTYIYSEISISSSSTSKFPAVIALFIHICIVYFTFSHPDSSSSNSSPHTQFSSSSMHSFPYSVFNEDEIDNLAGCLALFIFDLFSYAFESNVSYLSFSPVGVVSPVSNASEHTSSFTESCSDGSGKECKGSIAIFNNMHSIWKLFNKVVYEKKKSFLRMKEIKSSDEQYHSNITPTSIVKTYLNHSRMLQIKSPYFSASSYTSFSPLSLKPLPYFYNCTTESLKEYVHPVASPFL
jgi:hypothetical protein